MIPFNRPSVVGNELDYIRQAISGGQIAGDGPFTRRCHDLLRQQTGIEQVLLTHSCTAALEMTALLLDLGPDDEVIMPSFTFVSTANAVCLRGATPVFVDIDPDTLNIDPDMVERAITPKTRAVYVVHYAGLPCDMDRITDISRDHGLSVVEDAAQALGSTYKGGQAGTFGALSAFSFHETKTVISGEGGFLGINDERFVERAEIIREKGTNRSAFFRGDVDKYTWVDIGSSYLPGELISAFLLGQLEQEPAIRQQRLRHWQRYDDELSGMAANKGVRTPSVPNDRTHNGHMYYLRFDQLSRRQNFIQFMREQQILTPFHYVPLHSAPAGRTSARTYGAMTVTDQVAEGLVRLPLFLMADDTQDRVIEATQTYLEAL